YMMERLQEELARAGRHKIPLSLAIGELKDEEENEAPILPEWSTELIIKGKRRCDVAGHYGPKNFLLLMVHTPRTGGVCCLQRLQQAIEHPAETLQRPHVQAYFGLTTTHGEAAQPQSLLRAAEQHLESARADEKLRIVADRSLRRTR